MATRTHTQHMTVDEFYRWVSRPGNQDKFYELDEGEIIEMPPPGELHGILCAWIVRLLWRYVEARGKGYVCSNDTGLVIRRRPATVRGPDIMLYDENRPLRKFSRKFAQRLPRLVVEVLSSSDRMAKMNRKVSQYLKRGIPLVWVVDPEAEAISVYRPGQDVYVVEGEDEITGEEVLPGLRFRVAEFFTLPGQ